MKDDAIILKPKEYLALPTIPDDWDYDTSAKRVGGLFYKWKNITAEIAVDLYIAREVLSQKRNKCYVSQTWTSYCQEIGIERMTAHRWLEKFFPSPELEPHETPSLPSGKYRVIYADPPWPVDSMVLDKWESPLDDKYPTMTIEEIKAVPIPPICADDCSLFLWTTHTYLREAFDVIETWGFKYHCCITWNKGSGWSLCGFHRLTEFCLYAYRGNINVNQVGEFIPTLITEKKRKHSQKPDKMYELIESNTPEPRIELFARIEREGWKVWGNQI
jgi:N6-adenosine-specific RNA methylase IME4